MKVTTHLGRKDGDSGYGQDLVKKKVHLKKKLNSFVCLGKMVFLLKIFNI